MPCLLIEFLEYRAWRRRTYGFDFDSMVSYANFLEAYLADPWQAGFWRDE